MDRDHDGRGVVCPACSRLLRLPVQGDEIPPLTLPQVASAGEEVAEQAAPASGKRRARRKKKHEADFEETLAADRPPASGLMKGLVATLSLAALIFVVVLLWPTGGPKPVPVDAPAGFSIPDRLGGEGEPEADGGRVEISSGESVAFVAGKIEPQAKAFLLAETLTEKAGWTPDPERALERMRNHYAGDYVPEGWQGVVWTVPVIRENDHLSLQVVTGDFESRTIWAVETKDGWKIDWESWVGWSDPGWKEFIEKRPKDSVRLRAKVSAIDYYNFSFSDEIVWTSFQLENIDQEMTLYGYVPRGTRMAETLRGLQRASDRPFVLRVRFAGEEAGKNQVIIEEILAEGWLDREGDS